VNGVIDHIYRRKKIKSKGVILKNAYNYFFAQEIKFTLPSNMCAWWICIEDEN
jgi:hypothetical protein